MVDVIKKMPIFDSKFWCILKYLDNLSEVTSLTDLKSELTMPELKDCELIEVINFLQKFNYDIHLIVNKDEVYIHPFEDKQGIQVLFSFSEWIALQTHFPLFSKYADHNFGKDLIEKLDSVMDEYPNYNIYSNRANEQNKEAVILRFHRDKADIISKIEAAINNKSLLLIELSLSENYELYPHRLVYLEQQLTLIAENIKDKKLESIHIGQIEKLTVTISKKYAVNFSKMEIDDFIYALRAVNGDEERLILKILSNKDVDMQPSYQFMGTPYRTSNMNGDTIWAASVEVSEPLMEWLYQVKNNVEIIDPVVLRERFNEYCQKRNDEEKYRKVS